MDADAQLRAAATSLCRHVNGADWDAQAVQSDVNALLSAGKEASASALAAALNILLDRLSIARLEHADGVAQVAISAGTLVEHGAPPRPLALVLLEKLPGVLAAARRYADRCLAGLPPPEDDGEEEGIVEIDQRGVPLEVFRAHLAEDRGGACALHGLSQWCLPAIASLT